ncbi:MAG TPA: two-component regulator propeller domain-containing protein, partial [Pyrinomonadaceae bacterium]
MRAEGRGRGAAGRRRGATRPCLLFAFCLLPAACCLLIPSSAEESTTQPTSLHRWGAVTLFHGLPSDQVRAVAQDAEGQMWFGTDS